MASHSGLIASKTMAFTRIRHCIIAVHGQQSPSDDEWDSYVEFAKKHVIQDVQRTLVVTEGGAPSTMQRKALVEAIGTESKSDRVAVVTSSRIAHLAVTALRWFWNPIFRTFQPDRLGDALEYLGITEPMATEMRNAVALLRAEIAPEERRRASGA